ncbi:MAG: U32 family peptidase [Clostridiales bacterium]|nr:U32 family peptidase [Clostridiales bacterium]
MARLELLAPAGSLDILKKAVDCGADAVYCGLSGEYNARGNAINFTISELEDGIDYAHLKNSKVYLTCNTLLSDSEIDSYLPVLAECGQIGIDAFIIQDLGLLRLVNDYIGIPVNASTQMNVFGTSEYGALKEYGIRRIVLPRELTMSEIAERARIAESYGLETEVFCHGAVCICQSGLCLYSAMNRSGTRSGNRGLCAQPCREEYKLKYNDELIRKGHLLSPKDRDISGYIKDLIDAGVASVKIEGRMRDADYVGNTVSLYRSLIDACYEGYNTDKTAADAYNGLLINFNRGGSFTSQNMSGTKDPDILSGEFPGKYGLKIGRIMDTSSFEGIISVKCLENIVMPKAGDVLSIRSADIEVCSFPLGKINDNGRNLDIKGLHPDTIKKVKPGMDVFLMSHKFEGSSVRRSVLDMKLCAGEGKMTLSGSVNVLDKTVQSSLTSDLDMGYDNSLPEDRIKTQLAKLGSTPFSAGDIVISGDIRCPVSLINSMRRDLCDSLEDKIKTSFRRDIADIDMTDDMSHAARSAHKLYTMYTYTYLKGSASIIRPGADYYQIPVTEIISDQIRREVLEAVDKCGGKLIVQLPGLIHDEQKVRYDRVITSLKDKCYAVSTSEKLSSAKFNAKKILSPEGNVYNSISYKSIKDDFEAISLSLELSPIDVINIVSSTEDPSAVIVQKEGPVIWMQSDFCPVGRNASGCNICKNKRIFELVQSNNEVRYVVTDPTQCSSRIFGPAKNLWTDNDISQLNSYADVIINHTFI